MFLNSEVCIINNVGYPQPNHSHFRSLEIWQTASDADTYLHTGWLGRYADSLGKKATPGTLIEIDDALSPALKGEYIKGMAFRDVEMLYQAAQSIEKRVLSELRHIPITNILPYLSSTKPLPTPCNKLRSYISKREFSVPG
jgi:hypothetical protein